MKRPENRPTLVADFALSHVKPTIHPHSVTVSAKKNIEMQIFTSLPTSLACNILRDWLTLRNVVALNSAFCCNAHRTSFEDLLQSDEYFVREMFRYPLRRSNNFHALAKFGSKIRRMDIKNDFESRLVTQYCHHLTHVYLKGPRFFPALWYALRDTLNANQHIEFLDIDLHSFELSPDVLDFAGISLPQLATLVLKGLRVEHKNLVTALQMSNFIVRLDLCATNLTKSTLVEVQRRCPNLIFLGLADTRIDGPWGDDALRELTAACPHIVHLNIKNALTLAKAPRTGLTDAGIFAVVQNLKGLQSLSIRGNIYLTNASLVHIYTHCDNTLHTLRLDCSPYLWQISNYGRSINTLLERCTHLRYLDMCDFRPNTAHAHDVAIILPAATLRNLRRLILSGSVVCDRNLTAIRNHGSNLQHLGLYNESVDNFSLSLLLEGCPNLVGLYVDLIFETTMDLALYSRDGLTVSSDLPDHLIRFNVDM